MYIKKALMVTFSSFDKEALEKEATNYRKENDYKIWREIYKEFRLLKWKWEYKIDLYKPIINKM